MRTTSSCRLLLTGALASYAVAQDCSTVCQSQGEDFVDGGSYFQNINSSDPFTAYETFAGCQNDSANNILVAPNGDQYECNTTPLQPSDTNQLVTCPIDKSQLYSGNWTIVVLSNNGQCAPIDYMRQFYISVGVQETSTILGGTITETSTSTPISSTILTETSTITSQAPFPVTTTVQSGSQQTYTTTPAPAVLFTTKGVVTITETRTSDVDVATSTITTSSCVATRAVVDRRNNAIVATVGPADIQALAASMVDNFVADASELLDDLLPRATAVARSGGSVIERHIIEKTVPARKIKMQKRHPDAATTTVTGPISTITSVVTAPLLSVTGTTTVLQTTTTTSTVTVVSDQVPPTTVTAARPTSTIYFFVPFEVTTRTITHPVTQTVTTTVTSC